MKGVNAGFPFLVLLAFGLCFAFGIAHVATNRQQGDIQFSGTMHFTKAGRKKLEVAKSFSTFPMRMVNGLYGAVLDSVRTAIHRCPDRYDIRDVECALALMDGHPTRTSVSQAMHRLLRKKEILVAKRGKGGRPTIYKK